MSASDDIERIMQRKLEAAQAESQARSQQLAKKLAAGAEAAQGFIALMQQRGVGPETIYRHEQVQKRKFSFPNRPNKHDTFELYEPVDRGWVVQYSIDDYGSPWLMSFLQTDGKLRQCSLRTVNTGFRSEGLLPRASRTAFQRGALCIKPGYEATAPHLTVDNYAEAARWYLT
ncbi:hypothetical protein ACQFX6_28165 [Streptomyces sp. DSM 41987]|uniref:hypothetical protein n=1 Tax=Streptomyces TaxID=1883 RepID=UPI0018E00FE9|nr:hypothetical protein [Streptomyces fildesensis]